MDGKDLITLTETVERSKSNTHQIQELKERLDKNDEKIDGIKDEQKSLYKIASSVEIIANNMQNLQDGLDEVKCGQEKLGQKMDNQNEEIKNEQKKLDEKIQAVNDKSVIKIDILDVLKKNWYKIAFGTGGISAAIYFIQQLLK